MVWKIEKRNVIEGECFLCPECLKFSKHFNVYITGTKHYIARIVNGTSEIEFNENIDADLRVCECPNCNFETEDHEDNFIVRIDLISKTIKPIGDYWYDNVDELKKIAKMYNLEVIE